LASVETVRVPPPSAAYVALLAGAAFMAASPIFVRLADVGPFASAFWRVALALPALWAWDRASAARTPRAAFMSWPIALAGLAFAGDLTFWHLSILGTTVANATFFATTAPVFVLLISWAFLREPVRLPMLAGLALCVLGGLALLGETFTLAPQRLTGDVFGIITAFFFGLYFLFVQAARRNYDSARVIFASSLVTALCLLAVTLIAGDTVMPRSLEGAAALVGLAMISHLGGQGLLAFALGTLPATFSSLVMFLEAVAAAAMAWLLFGEALSPLQIGGGLVIVSGIWVARPRSRGENR
jgi:drug/metabolite transporter (DMT)-like permease